MSRRSRALRGWPPTSSARDARPVVAAAPGPFACSRLGPHLKVPRQGFGGLIAAVGAGDNRTVEVRAELGEYRLDAADRVSQPRRERLASPFDRARAEPAVLAGVPGGAAQLVEQSFAFALDPLDPSEGRGGLGSR